MRKIEQPPAPGAARAQRREAGRWPIRSSRTGRRVDRIHVRARTALNQLSVSAWLSLAPSMPVTAGIRHFSPSRLDHLNNVFGHRHVLQLICQFGAVAI